MALSSKQTYVIQNSQARINLLTGAVRASKTYTTLYRWIQYVGREAPAEDLLIVGKTQTTAIRNIVRPLQALIGNACKWYPGRNGGECWIFDRMHYVVGANDEASEGKIRGMTCGGALCDEITLWPESFWTMLLSRCSPDGAKIFGATNPDTPYHYLKKDYIDERQNLDIDIDLFTFVLDDNPFLSRSFRENLKKEYRGLWYKRFILGLWVMAEGAVYDTFDENEHTIPLPPAVANEYVVGVDYGTSNPTCFGLFGINRSVRPWIWLEREYYYDSQKGQRQKDDAEYAADFEHWLNNIVPSRIFIDPSAASFKLALQKRKKGYVILDADNEVLDGIRCQSRMLNSGEYKICKRCEQTTTDYGAYLWDKNAQKRGEDKPMKQNDHTKDMERYVLNTVAGGKLLDYDKLTTK